MKKKKHILTLFQFTHWCIHEIVHNETKTSYLHLQYIEFIFEYTIRTFTCLETKQPLIDFKGFQHN